jgi:hypothetical protein
VEVDKHLQFLEEVVEEPVDLEKVKMILLHFLVLL